MSELNDAINARKANKQPGPDGIIMDFLQRLDLENKSLLLSLINSWWFNRTTQEELFMARVVPIYKKGDTDVASDYRPISLLNSAYKLYMIMITSRMQTGIAHKDSVQFPAKYVYFSCFLHNRTFARFRRINIIQTESCDVRLGKGLR